MFQLVQSLKTGETSLREIPAPAVKKNGVLIKGRCSLVSLGTERMLVEFGKANLLEKARQQPEKVRMVLDKISSDGLKPTLNAVFNKLDQPIPLGYCHVGEVIMVGDGVTHLKAGDRVASNGPHAEIISHPKNLVAKIPDNVSDEEAAFTVVASIGLQGIRLMSPTLGETVVVIGLGLIGLLTAQLLLLNGCRVIGIDLDENKLELARQKGVITCNPSKGDDPVRFVMDQTAQVGCDGVIITASSKSDEIISEAANMSRKRGRIVLVGVTGLRLNRSEFYAKELTFQVSCSYGPGRYDDQYEQQGVDYPLPFVRWTENRNFQTVLQLLGARQLDVRPLISEIIPLNEYHRIYSKIGKTDSIATILKYPEKIETATILHLTDSTFTGGKGVLGIIGAGNFTRMTLLPALDTKTVKYIASANGMNGAMLAQKYRIPNASTDYSTILNDEEVDLVLITTRHNEHARLALESLRAGKNVFVEKPLAIFNEELNEIEQYLSKNPDHPVLTVGFNRRFSRFSLRMKALLGDSPLAITATVNAGYIAPESWVHDRRIGGGRLIGEACHFIDLISFLTDQEVTAVCANYFGESPGGDSASIFLKYPNGSTGTIHYFTNGHKSYSKERIEAYSQGRTLILDNFRKLTGYGFKGFSSLSGKQDKGHHEQFRLLIERAKMGGGATIPLKQLLNTSRAALAIETSLTQRAWVEI